MIRGAPIIHRVILSMARVYAKAHRLPLAKVSRACYGDSKFLRRLPTKGGTVTTIKADEVFTFFHTATNWSKGVVPPEIIDLYEPIKDAAK